MDWQSFLTSTLGSATASAGLLLGVGWLSRSLIKERLTASIKHEYDVSLERLRSDLQSDNARRLEGLRTELARSQAIATTATQALLAAKAAAHDRTIEAVHAVWAAILKIDESAPSILGITDFASPEEIRASPSNPKLRELLERVTLDSIHDSGLMSNEVEVFRPFLGEYLWSLFWGYRALVGRVAVLFSRWERSDIVTYYLDDKGVMQLLRSMLTVDEVKAVTAERYGGFGLAKRFVQARIVSECRRVVEGERSADHGLEQAGRIVQAAAEALRSDGTAT